MRWPIAWWLDARPKTCWTIAGARRRPRCSARATVAAAAVPAATTTTTAQPCSWTWRSTQHASLSLCWRVVKALARLRKAVPATRPAVRLTVRLTPQAPPTRPMRPPTQQRAPRRRLRQLRQGSAKRRERMARAVPPRRLPAPRTRQAQYQPARRPLARRRQLPIHRPVDPQHQPEPPRRQPRRVAAQALFRQPPPSVPLAARARHRPTSRALWAPKAPRPPGPAAGLLLPVPRHSATRHRARSPPIHPTPRQPTRPRARCSTKPTKARTRSCPKRTTVAKPQVRAAPAPELLWRPALRLPHQLQPAPARPAWPPVRAGLDRPRRRPVAARPPRTAPAAPPHRRWRSRSSRRRPNATRRCPAMPARAARWPSPAAALRHCAAASVSPPSRAKRPLRPPAGAVPVRGPNASSPALPTGWTPRWPAPQGQCLTNWAWRPNPARPRSPLPC